MSGTTRPAISRAALERELGDSATRSVLKWLPLGSKIPNYEKLKVGDVVLSRRKRPDLFAKAVSASQAAQGYSSGDATWTHSMLYVGALHVVESNKPLKLKTGVQIVPLTSYCKDFELIILRHKDKEFADYRHHEVVRHGLLSHSIHPRRYDWPTAVAIRLGGFGIRPFASRIIERINCSEFVLECFAIGGGYMVERYIAIRDKDRDPPQYFLPASLAQDDSFEKIEMEYFDLERP